MTSLWRDVTSLYLGSTQRLPQSVAQHMVPEPGLQLRGFDGEQRSRRTQLGLTQAGYVGHVLDRTHVGRGSQLRKQYRGRCSWHSYPLRQVGLQRVAVSRHVGTGRQGARIHVTSCILQYWPLRHWVLLQLSGVVEAGSVHDVPPQAVGQHFWTPEHSPSCWHVNAQMPTSPGFAAGHCPGLSPRLMQLPSHSSRDRKLLKLGSHPPQLKC